ncbi:hypothetical protein Dimus_010096 [Dionaea muscipula]
MSGAPKRPHEEGSHSSSSSKYPHDDAGGSYINPNPIIAPEMGQDMRAAKIARTESRDVDRRSPLQSLYRMPSSSPVSDSHSHITHTIATGTGSRMDMPASREVKENREIKVESRDPKTDSREMYRHPAKVDKDGRFEGWGNMGSRVIGPVDPPKEGPRNDEREEYVEGNEAVGENKVDWKIDDRYKDKDRKRKEGKHRDWGDREKDRSDRNRINLQGGSSNIDSKDSIKEERDTDRWERERERRDAHKDKERVKESEKEKDHLNKEVGEGAEKECSHNDKEVADRTSEQENLVSEQKKPKDFDGWKAMERESRERRKEKDGNLEGERPDRRIRVYDKESDEGGADVDGSTERERESFGYGIQQRKRMLRPRGSPQAGNREARFRSRSQDADGSQVKSEVSTVVYKVGEYMLELVKLWKEYESSQPDKSDESFLNGPTLEIRIPAEYVTATNRQVRGGQLWGTDIYTNDSDLVAVLMHTGYCRPTASPPPPAIQELRATIRVLPPQDCYVSTLRNNVRSRAWGAAIGCSYRVERCCIVKKGGGTIDLEPCLTHASTVEPTLAPVAVERTMTTRAAASNALRQQRFVREVTIQYNLCNEPWYSLFSSFQ